MVVGAKGGVGATVVACHLAVLLARPQTTALVDLDVGGGDVASVLDLGPTSALRRLIDQLDDADLALVRGSMVDHPSGLLVLPQPWDPTEVPDPSEAEVRQLLELLGQVVDTLVVDAGVALSVPALSACRLADEILMVVTPRVAAMRNLQRLRTVLARLEVPDDRIRLVVNREGEGNMLTADDVEAHVGLPVAHRLPSDQAATARADSLGRLLFDKRVRALTSEVRMSGMILGGMPLATVGAMLVFVPDDVQPLWTTHFGRQAAMGAGSMVAPGWTVMRWLSKVES